MDTPDFIDLVQGWIEERYPQLHLEIVKDSCTDGKVVVVHRLNPRSWELHRTEGWTGRDRDKAWERNYLFSLSRGGTLWRHYLGNTSRDIDMKISPADPNVFTTLDNMIIRRLNED